MKKRFFGVLLALAALGLVASSAMAAVTLSPSISITVGSGTATTTALSISESTLSSDIVSAIVVSSDTAANLEGAVGSKYVYAPADVTITADGSSAVKIASAGTTGLAFKAVLVPSYAYKVPEEVKPAAFEMVDASTGKKYAEDGKKVTSISFTPVASANAYLLTVVSDDSYKGKNTQVLVKLPVKIAQTDSEGEETQMPTAINFSTMTDATFNALLGASANAQNATQLALQQTLADKMGEGIHYPTMEKTKATKGQVSEVSKKAEGVVVTYPSLEATVSSAYVIGLLAPDMSHFEDDHFKYDRSTKSSLVSVAAYGDVTEMGDVLYMVYDKADDEFREYEAADGQQDIVFMAFHMDPGTFQPFIATGASTDPSSPSTEPSSPSTEPTNPSTEPTNPSSSEDEPSNPSSKKGSSSGSGGCDMGMVSGLAILLAALLPLRKVRR